MASELSINPGEPGVTPPFLAVHLHSNGEQSHLFLRPTPDALRILADELEAHQNHHAMILGMDNITTLSALPIHDGALLSTIMLTYEMTVWNFTKPGEPNRQISAIFNMTEAQATEKAECRWGPMEGYTATRLGVPVVVEDPPDPNAPPKNKFRVTFTRTQTAEIDVEAENEEEAKELAKEELEPEDWEIEDFGDDTSVRDLGPVKPEVGP